MVAFASIVYAQAGYLCGNLRRRMAALALSEGSLALGAARAGRGGGGGWSMRE
jgi:hypothetical protein